MIKMMSAGHADLRLSADLWTDGHLIEHWHSTRNIATVLGYHLNLLRELIDPTCISTCKALPHLGFEPWTFSLMGERSTNVPPQAPTFIGTRKQVSQLLIFRVQTKAYA